ncbi:MAG: ribonuclease J [Rhodospirillales bacterium]
MVDELVFLPLGGSGEIGMNLNLYGYGPPEDRRWLMVDLGITFNGGQIAGVDVVCPDPAYIAARRDRLDGLLLTHAHEDHLGAVPYLWPHLGCPVYGSAFALAILRRKLDQVDWGREVPLHLLPEDGRLRIGRFDLETIPVTHSIPEASAVAIHTAAGTVLHTGDWKFDPDPVVGPVSDEAALCRLGDAGVLALVCDSTNVFEKGTSGSEAALLASLSRLIAECRERVVVACFASNVARLHTIARAARENGRDVVMTGHSLKRNYQAAVDCGYLRDLPPFIDDRLGTLMPRARTLIVCTGGQGEPRAALSRLAADDHPQLSIDEGDAVIFSSRVIPGNELAIGRLCNQLVRRGVRILGQRDGLVHVSGHPAEDELARMYRLVRPRVAIPVHGELRHLTAHARLARREGVKEAIVIENGALVRLFPDPPMVAERVQVGRLAVEGNRLEATDGDLVKQRTKALYNGVALVTLVLGSVPPRETEEEIPGETEVHISTVGLAGSDEEAVRARVRAAVLAAVAGLPARGYDDDETVRDAIRLVVRRTFRQLFEKRPVTYVHLVRTHERQRGKNDRQI